MNPFRRLPAGRLSRRPRRPARLGADEPKVTTENDVVYTKAGGTELKLDLARAAEGDGPFPVVLVIHGGGWRGGNKSDTRPALAEFARRGYVAVSPQYRFCPKETFPAQVHDVKAAVRWVKAHAKEYKVDPEHVGAVGFSAGGAPRADARPDRPLRRPRRRRARGRAPTRRIQAVVNYFGPTDLAANDIPDPSPAPWSDFLGGTAEEKPEAAAQGVAPDVRLEGRRPRPHLPGDQGPARPLHPGHQARRRHDRRRRPRPRRAPPRRRPRLGGRRVEARPWPRRSPSSTRPSSRTVIDDARTGQAGLTSRCGGRGPARPRRLCRARGASRHGCVAAGEGHKCRGFSRP